MPTNLAHCPDLKAVRTVLDLRPEALACTRDAANLAEFITRLTDAEHYSAAVRVLAHALPLRQALWWACLCVFDARNMRPAQDQDRLLHLVFLWVINPNDDTRRRAESATSETDECEGCLAAALARSQSTLIAAQFVEAGVLIAAESLAGRSRSAVLRDWLYMGLQIADGRLPWPAPTR